NAPAGKLAQALFYDPRLNNVEAEAGFPVAWLNLVSALLTLTDDLRRHALVIFFHNVNWLYAIDPAWTEDNLLSILEGGNEQDADAAWSGFLWGAKLPHPKLYSRLKPRLLGMANKPISSRRT